MNIYRIVFLTDEGHKRYTSLKAENEEEAWKNAESRFPEVVSVTRVR